MGETRVDLQHLLEDLRAGTSHRAQLTPRNEAAAQSIRLRSNDDDYQP